MEITLMGYVLIPLGVFLLFFKTQYLFMFSIFFSGFTNSGVINFINADFTLTAPIFLFALLIFKYFFHLINKKTLVKPDATLSLFIVICTASLVMPSVLSSQTIEIASLDGGIATLKFSFQNITQFMYIFFSFLVYWLSKDILWNDPSKIAKYMNAYFLGALAICLIGYYQIIAATYDLPYDEIFHDSLIGYGAMADRVYSVAQEPSVLAFFTGPTMALLLFYKTDHFFMPKIILMIMLLILGFLTKSTSFLLAIILFMLFLLYRNMLKIHYTKENISTIKRFLFFTGIIILILILLVTFNPDIQSLVFTTIEDTADKLQIKNTSGIERLTFATTMFKAFLKSPVFGIGFGSARSTDLLTTWLANVGLVGFVTFAVYAVRLYRSLSKISKQKCESSSLRITEGYMYFFVILMVLALISVAEPYYLFIWLHLGFAESYVRFLKNKQLDSTKI